VRVSLTYREGMTVPETPIHLSPTRYVDWEFAKATGARLVPAGAKGTTRPAAASCRAGISVHAYGDENTRTRQRPRALSRSRADFATGARDLFLATGKIKGL